MKSRINISLIRIIKAKKEKNNNEELEVEYKNGIFILINNFQKFDEYKKARIYIPITIISDIQTVADHLLYRLQKEKLNPIESALLYSEYEEINEINSHDLARKINVSQGNISNKKRLLKLPLMIQIDIINKKITERHGRALLQLANNQQILKEVYEEIKLKKLKVSDTEILIDKKLNKKKKEVDTKITKLENKRDIKNQTAILAINQLEKDMSKTMEVITKYYPELDINFNSGTKNKDYILEISIKNVK